MFREYFNLESIRLKFRVYIFPQFIVSVIVAITYPFIYQLAVEPLLGWLYRQTGLGVFQYQWLFSLFILPFTFFGLFYFFYGRKTIRIFKGRFSNNFSLAIFPSMVGFLAAGLIFAHQTNSKEHLYVIPSVAEVEKNSDSIEVYRIGNYYIPYDQYQYSVELRSVTNGSRHNRSHDTKVITSIVCPLLGSKSESYSPSKQYLWVGFEYSAELSGNDYEFDSPDVKETVRGHLEQFNKQYIIYYFRETRNAGFPDVIREKFNKKPVNTENTKVLEPYFEAYSAYNGWQFLAYAGLVLLGGNLFVFFIVVFCGLNDNERSRIMGLKNVQWR